MLLPRPEDALHKAMMYRILIAFADNVNLASVLRFKGGTCAAMMGYLNRFSVDLDFDFLGDMAKRQEIRNTIEKIVFNLGFEIKDYSKKGIQYFLKYETASTSRNTLKLDVAFPVPHNNLYDFFYFSDIDRTLGCQTIETMFANKLVSILDRYEKYHSIAGRDLYDVHSFFLKKLDYEESIIEERRKTSVKVFFKELINFVKQHFTETIINQELNVLLPPKEFQQVRRTLKQEVVMLLEEELALHNAMYKP